MQVTEHTTDGTEGTVVAGMVMQDAVCGHIAGLWGDNATAGPFASRWANLVGWWCVQHYRAHGEAPQRAIDPIANAWAESWTGDEATVDLVNDYLDALEEPDELPSVAYMLDAAGQHLNKVRLANMATAVQGALALGDVDKAEDAVAKYSRVELGVGAGIKVMTDPAYVQRVFAEQSEGLVHYSGGLGKFWGNQLARDEFVALTGATGRGKTWWLIDIGMQAVRCSQRTAFFEVGDMSERQIGQRLMTRIARHPMWPGTVQVPTDIQPPDPDEGPDAIAQVRYKEKTYTQPLDAGKAWAECQRRTKRRGKDLLRLSVHPNSDINVNGIERVMQGWARTGWTPAVVVVDYADVLAPLPGYPMGDRNAINATWAALRGLSQRWGCLVVTATQGDAGSYGAGTIRRGNFSDDRRKNDHVTAMVGINATEAEQQAGIFRLNYLKRREETYSESRCCYVASCLKLARAHVKSVF